MGNWNPESASERQAIDAQARHDVLSFPIDKPDITIAELSRRQAWDSFFSSHLGMNLHPGTTRDAAKPRSYEELAALADEALALRDLRFPE